jgi:branched-chain amino acid transport system ATP-binding protein
MSRPRLLCLDEPTMGLTPLFVARVFEFLTERNRAGTTIFMVEQNATAALEIADRGYVLRNGHRRRRTRRHVTRRPITQRRPPR